jgi:hypothetical protein
MIEDTYFSHLVLAAFEGEMAGPRGRALSTLECTWFQRTTATHVDLYCVTLALTNCALPASLSIKKFRNEK